MASTYVSDADLTAFVAVYRACGLNKTRAAEALRITRPKAQRLFARAVREGLLDPDDAVTPGGRPVAAKPVAPDPPPKRDRYPFEHPMSEDPHRFHADWTREQCIAELQRVARANPDQVISRNWFRVTADISESTWNRYFGTFEEFKRQAGIKLSRHQHRLERSIAKHAAGDTYRRLTADKNDWGAAYLKPSGRRWQTVLTIADVHDRHCDPFYRRLVIDTARRVQPDLLILDGDIFDLPEFSRFSQDPRGWDVTGRIRWVHGLLRELRAAAPNAQIDFIEGNHEFRLLRHFAEATPALKVVLDELHSIATVADLLRLNEFELNYVARSDLTAFTERDIRSEVGKNWKLYHDCFLASHYPTDRSKNIPGVSGHHHEHQCWPLYSPTLGPGEWHQIGAGHIPWASYCDGENWSNGFLLTHIDVKARRTQSEYIDCSHEHCVIGGLWYTRTEDERRAA